MRSIHALAAASLTSVLAAGVLGIVTPTAEAADVSRALPIGAYRDMVVDEASGYAFIAGTSNNFIDDGYTGGVVAAKVDGSSAGKIAQTTDAESVTLGPDGLVYAAEPSGTIVQIDPSTRTVVHSFPTGDAGCPHAVAFAGTQLWFGFGGCPGTTDVGVAALDTATGTVTVGLSGAGSGTVRLRSVPTVSGALLATGLSTTTSLQLLAISGTTVTIAHDVSGVAVNDFAVSPDGSTVLVATQSGGQTYSATDLTAGSSSYEPADGRQGAAAYSADGHYVALANGNDAWRDVVDTFGPDSTTRVRRYDTSTPGSANVGQTTNPAEHGIAWSGHVLLAVYVDYGNGYPTLKVLQQAALYPTSMTFSGPATAARAQAVTLSGVVSTAAGAVGGVQLTVTKTDLAGAHLLAPVTTTGAGAFTIHDTPTIGGTNTYVVGYAGTATNAAVSRSFRVAVSRVVPALSLTTNHTSYSYGQRQYVKAYLGTTYNSRTVSVAVCQYGTTTWHTIATARVDSHGYLSASFAANRNVAIRAVFAGDYRYAPRTVIVRRAVRAWISSITAGSYGKSGKYLLFHHSKGGALAVGVKANKGGEQVNFRLQIMRNGSWHTAATDSEYLNQYGVTGVVFVGRTYTPLRIRAEFPGDSVNAAVAARWWYVQFR